MCVHAEEGDDVQAQRLGTNAHEMLYDLICRKTNSSQNNTEMNQLLELLTRILMQPSQKCFNKHLQSFFKQMREKKKI